MIALDANAVIAAINRRPRRAREWLLDQLTRGAPIGLPAIAYFEMVYGYEKSLRREANKAALETFLSLGIDVWAFDPGDAAEAGVIRAALEATGTPIGAYHALIAAQARKRGAALVTLNRREFERVPGLIVTDWGE